MKYEFQEATASLLDSNVSELDAVNTIYRAFKTCGGYGYRDIDNDRQHVNDIILELTVMGHLSVLEHVSLSVEVITSRAIMDELTRHRHSSFSVQSTRWGAYKDGLVFIYPSSMDNSKKEEFEQRCRSVGQIFVDALSEEGQEVARGYLPLCVLSRAIVTCNIRQWLYMLKLRGYATRNNTPHKDMIYLMQKIRKLLCESYPTFFNDQTC